MQELTSLEEYREEKRYNAQAFDMEEIAKIKRKNMDYLSGKKK